MADVDCRQNLHAMRALFGGLSLDGRPPLPPSGRERAAARAAAELGAHLGVGTVVDDGANEDEDEDEDGDEDEGARPRCVCLRRRRGEWWGAILASNLSSSCAPVRTSCKN